MGLFDSLFGGNDNHDSPANAGMNYLNQIPGMEHQGYDPYIGYGRHSYDTMRGPMDQMASDPAAFMEALSAHYQPSKSYELARDETLKSAGNTAAAGGMRGSLNDISNEARLTDMLLGQDKQQWLNNVLGIQDRGMKDQMHMFDTGYDANKSLTGDLSNVAGTQAGMAFQGQRDKDQRHSDLMSALMGLGGSALGWLSGGPIGSAIGNRIGGAGAGSGIGGSGSMGRAIGGGRGLGGF